VGESNRELTFLTSEEGLIRATVFGGPKSRLRAHMAPYHRGKLWIYRDPVKDFLKVTDFDVQSWRPGIRELYERTTAAQAVAETILAARGGGGNWEEALALADGVLEALDQADEAGSRRMVIQFFWNWVEFLGLRPETGRCASCACEAPPDGLVWYSKREGTLICPSCAALPSTLSSANYGGAVRAEEPMTGETAGFLPLGPGARRWLAAVENRDPSQLARLTMDRTSEREAKALVTAILAEALGRPLGTWNYL
jgi:DNA repair protein RecO (recombination protein O)